MMCLSNIYIKLIFVLLIIPLSKCSLSEKKVAFHSPTAYRLATPLCMTVPMCHIGTLLMWRRIL